MSNPDDLAVGDIIFSTRQYMMIISVDGQYLTACPFVPEGELRHRADMALAWFELAEAGLPHADMRLRTIPCRREKRGIRRIGCVAEGVWRRALMASAREAHMRRREVGSFGGPVSRAGVAGRESVPRAMMF